MNSVNIFYVLPSAPATDWYDGVNDEAFLSLILIDCMDAAKVGQISINGSSAFDVGNHRLTAIKQRRQHPFIYTADRHIGSPDDPQTIPSISGLSNG